MDLELFILIGIGSLSAIATFVLHNTFKQGTVRASALLGILSCVFVVVFSEMLSEYLIKNIPLISFGASFIGMVSSSVVSNYFLLGCSGGVFTFVFLNANSMFKGFGGGLGAAACISLLVVLALPILLKKSKKSTVYSYFKKYFDKN